MSFGEEKIIEILNKAGINFKTQYEFDDLIFPSGRKARFDFYIDNKYIVEYDGEQHFQYRGSGWNTEENFMRTLSNDLVKNQYCIDNNIPIIRIPYTNFNDLCLEDLQLENSEFIYFQ